MTRNRVLAAGAAGAVLVVVLWYLALWTPRQSSISKARKRVEVAQQQASDLQLRLGRLQDLKKGEVQKRAQIEALRVAVPDQPNLAQFILDANDAAAKAGIDFLSISPQQPSAAAPGPAKAAAAGAGPVEIRMAMQISGGYFQVLNFVNLLDDLPRIVTIDTINVTPSQDAQLSVALQGRMFTAGAVAGPTTPTPNPNPATTTAVTTPAASPSTTVVGAP